MNRGDLVQIRQWRNLCHLFPTDGDRGLLIDGIRFHRECMAYCGREGRIVEIGTGCYYLDGFGSNQFPEKALILKEAAKPVSAKRATLNPIDDLVAYTAGVWRQPALITHQYRDDGTGTGEPLTRLENHWRNPLTFEERGLLWTDPFEDLIRPEAIPALPEPPTE